MLDSVANQIVEQIEAEKIGQERAHASTPLNMALNLIFAIRSSRRRHGGDKGRLACRKLCPPTNTRQKCNGQRKFSTTDLVYHSLYFIYSLFCLFTGCMCETRSTCTSALPLAMFITNRHLGCNKHTSAT